MSNLELQMTSASVQKPSRDVLETRAMAQLHNAVWNASQFHTAEELVSYIEGTLRDIARDEP